MPGQNITRASVHDVQQRLQEAVPPLLLDVREADEWQHCRIEGALHIPMSQFTQHLGELSPERPVVVYCHHGGRSERVAYYLLQQGFADVSNLEGGIDAWSIHIDPSVPRYR